MKQKMRRLHSCVQATLGWSTRGKTNLDQGSLYSIYNRRRCTTRVVPVSPIAGTDNPMQISCVLR